MSDSDNDDDSPSNAVVLHPPTFDGQLVGNCAVRKWQLRDEDRVDVTQQGCAMCPVSGRLYVALRKHNDNVAEWGAEGELVISVYQTHSERSIGKLLNRILPDSLLHKIQQRVGPRFVASVDMRQVEQKASFLNLTVSDNQILYLLMQSTVRRRGTLLYSWDVKTEEPHFLVRETLPPACDTAQSVLRVGDRLFFGCEEHIVVQDANTGGFQTQVWPADGPNGGSGSALLMMKNTLLKSSGSLVLRVTAEKPPTVFQCNGGNPGIIRSFSWWGDRLLVVRQRHVEWYDIVFNESFRDYTLVCVCQSQIEDPPQTYAVFKPSPAVFDGTLWTSVLVPETQLNAWPILESRIPRFPQITNKQVGDKRPWGQ